MSNKLEQFLNVESEWVLEKLSCSYGKGGSEADRAYYQGRVDQLAQVRRLLGHPQLIIKREGR